MSELQQYMDSLPNPEDTIAALDEYIVGQADAKKNLSVLLLVRSMIKMQLLGLIPGSTEIQKTNLLLIGPTGSGKTALIKALSEIADVPILIKDMTGITSAGYVGHKVEDILIEYVNMVNDWCRDTFSRSDWIYLHQSYETFFLDTLETGIIYLDEVDKIQARGARSGNDVTGDMVQNELLKLLEGGIIHLTGDDKRGPKCAVSSLDTRNITFICGGAFQGLPEIIVQRLNKTNGIGFNSEMNTLTVQKDLSKILEKVKTEDLIEYGFKPEFLGRLPLKSSLDEITHDLMLKIISEPKNCIHDRYKEFFKLFDVDLTINKQALSEIATKALDLKMGARSLHQIFNDLFLDDLTKIFHLKGKRLYISKADVIKRLN